MKSLAKFRLVVGAVALLVLAMAALPCFAGELAVLRNGFSIRHERREVVGDTTRLYVSADGSSFVDVPTDQIEHFEAAPALPDSESRPPSGSELVAGRKSKSNPGAPTSLAPTSFVPNPSLAPRASFASARSID